MTTLVSDSFTDTNGVDLSSHTPETNTPGNAYVLYAHTGSPTANSTEIQSNKLNIDTSFEGFTLDVETADHEISFDWVIGSTTGIRNQITIRRSDSTNRYFWSLREPQDDWRFIKEVAGVETVVGTGSYTFNTSTTYAIKVVTVGTSAKLYIDDVLITTQTMDAYGGTTVIGYSTASISAADEIDNLLITDGAASISVDDASIDPEVQTVTITKSEAWVGTVTATLGGGAITLSGAGATTRTFSVSTADLLPGGTLNALKFSTNYTLAVTDTNGTYNYTVQIVPTLTGSEDYGAKHASIEYITFPAGSAANDETFGFWHTGDGIRDTSLLGTIESGTGYFSPSSLPSQGRLMVYDISGAVWLAAVDTDLFAEAQPDNQEGILCDIVRNVVKRLRRVI